ncbi:MAG TPA: hypothetical protein QKA08_03570 [Candidatus Megaira endosymbiont of Nemacystus decipiens]|nr:hypothetical protein [Candidatus Megaera endosymbiont of Nemacystus decipiens]
MNSYSITLEDVNKTSLTKFLKELDTNNITKYQKEGKLNFNETDAKTDFTENLDRGTIIHLKNGESLDRIVDEEITENIAKDKNFNDNQRDELLEALLEKVDISLKKHGISKEQSDYIKSSSHENAVANASKNILNVITVSMSSSAEYKSAILNNNALAQIEIRDGDLIYKSVGKILFDKEFSKRNITTLEKNIVAHSTIDSNDYIITNVEINLGKVGDKKFTPKLECNFCADGKVGNQLLHNIKNKINEVNKYQKLQNDASKDRHRIKQYENPDKNKVNVEHQNKKSAIIKINTSDPNIINKEYSNTMETFMEKSGKNKQHEDKITQDIVTLLNNKKDDNTLSFLKKIPTTKKVLPLALANHIDSELNNSNQCDSKTANELINRTSTVLANITDKPKGYVKILMKEIISERAKEENINVPKKGFIEKISDTIKLLYYSAKGENKSQDLDKFQNKKSHTRGR